MGRDYTAVPHEYLIALSALTDEEFGRLMRGLFNYSATGELPELSGRESLLWGLVKLKEDSYQAYFADISEKRSAAAKKANDAKASKRMQTDANGCNAPKYNTIQSNTIQSNTIQSTTDREKEKERDLLSLFPSETDDMSYQPPPKVYTTIEETGFAPTGIDWLDEDIIAGCNLRAMRGQKA